MSAERLPEGSVHGRFQPFHLGHLEYCMAAARRSQRLWVGVTQPESENLQAGLGQPVHRYSSEDNPLTYWERVRVIRASLLSRLASERFIVVPFPIERPSALTEFVPTSATAFTTIYDDWNRQKVQILRDAGYLVEVLWDRSGEEKAVSGSEVRRLMRSGDDRWRALVPHQSAECLDELGVPDRIARSAEGG